MASTQYNRYEYYRSHYYANKHQVNNENGTKQQYETTLYEEMVHLPLPTETEENKQNHQNDTVIEMKSTGHEE